jgi:mannitol/fructose-specific phosphotransferase system IIA component (Ntr-type)
MVLDKVISKQTIKFGVPSGADKWTLISDLVDLVIQSTGGGDRHAILSAVIDREKAGSTGLENGVAIPHARSSNIGGLVAALAISKEGIDFDSADGRPCHLVFLIVAPPQESTRYLKALADVAFIGSGPERVSALVGAGSPDDALRILGELGGANSEDGNGMAGSRSSGKGGGLR